MRPSAERNDEMRDVIGRFSSEYHDHFSRLSRDLMARLVQCECVHSDQTNRLKPRVVLATKILREEMGVDSSICLECSKKEECRDTEFPDEDYNHLEALLHILYLIRNNLNHHGKLDLTQRNLALVGLSCAISEEILRPFYSK